MKLATFQAPGSPHPLAGEVIDDRVWAFSDSASVRDVLAGVSASRSGDHWSLAEVTLLAPIPDPRAIYGAGRNYGAHVTKAGGEPPSRPLVFTKVPGAVAAPGGPVRCPSVVARLDYEGELVVVIGAQGTIGGYCVANDVSARDLQNSEPQWTRAKGADTFCPYGPWVTTADEVPDPGDLRLRTWVCGELRQNSRTADMIFGCQELVDFISEACTLLPGDLILTGTPGGVGASLDPPRFLQPGDVVRIEIEGLGSIEHPVVRRGGSSSRVRDSYP